MPLNSTNEGDTLQSRVLRSLTVLHHLRPDWGGALILNTTLDPASAALSLAANIAGAVCLSLESDSTLLREAQRTGSCDFVVNTLDEALRAMKNEVRKHLPLSVGLAGNPNTLLQEILDRGVAPQLFTGAPTHPEAARHFNELGALLVNFNEESAAATTLLEAFLTTHPWRLHTFPFTTPAELRAFDTQALSLLPPEDQATPADQLRRRWLHAAPRILPRERTRTLWLTGHESEILQTKQP